MAQNITIAGATYHDVTAVSLKNTDGVDVIYSEQSGAAATKSDVNFYDYDGTLVAGYTIAEAQALSALPSAPSHDGLTFQGWNYTLAQINALTDKADIGAMYVTSDGKTQLNIRIAAFGRMTVPLYISQTVANGVTIDWGDGSASQTLSGTGNVNTTHTYSAIGDYVILFTVADGCVLGLGDGTGNNCVMGSTGTPGCVYSNMLYAVYIGNRVTSIGPYAFYNCYSLASIAIPSGVTSISTYAFYYCYSLASVTIPSGVTSIGTYAFYNCYSLASVTIPSGVTSISDFFFYYCYSLASVTIPSGVTRIGTYAFGNCYSLASVTIPSGVTSISDFSFYNCNGLASITIPSGVTSISTYAFYSCYSLAIVTIPSGITSIGNSTFYNCRSLASVTIPSGVTSIGNSTFYNCFGMAIYDFSPVSTVPTLANTNAFTGIRSDCQIRVPSALVATWKAATNWATYASYIVGV